MWWYVTPGENALSSDVNRTKNFLTRILVRSRNRTKWSKSDEFNRIFMLCFIEGLKIIWFQNTSIRHSDRSAPRIRPRFVLCLLTADGPSLRIESTGFRHTHVITTMSAYRFIHRTRAYRGQWSKYQRACRIQTTGRACIWWADSVSPSRRVLIACPNKTQPERKTTRDFG